MLKRIVLFAAVSVLLGRCATQSTQVPEGAALTASVAALVAEPGRYERRRVVATGIVGQRLTVLGFGGFELLDPASGAALFVGTPYRMTTWCPARVRDTAFCGSGVRSNTASCGTRHI